MHLTPDIVANVLARRKVITVDQATEIKKTARRLPRHQRSQKAFEQRSVAFERAAGLR